MLLVLLICRLVATETVHKFHGLFGASGQLISLSFHFFKEFAIVFLINNRRLRIEDYFLGSLDISGPLTMADFRRNCLLRYPGVGGTVAVEVTHLATAEARTRWRLRATAVLISGAPFGKWKMPWRR